MNWKHRKTCFDCGGKVSMEFSPETNLFRAHCKNCGHEGTWEESKREAWLNFSPRQWIDTQSSNSRREFPKLALWYKPEVKPLCNRRERRKFRQRLEEE